MIIISSRGVWQYDPKPDITAYELAQIIPFLTRNILTNYDELFAGLPVTVKRHFTLVK